MKLTSRSFPHPVVGNRDDVPGAAFQAVIEMSTDKDAVYIDTGIRCSSDVVTDLVKKQNALFVIHVECSNTLYRRAFEFNEMAHRIQIPRDRLHDAVEVNVFARAARNLSGYRVDHAHADYRNASFNVERGDILAVGEGQVFYLDSPFDALSPIGSIMEIQESQEDGDLPMRVDFYNQKILIILSKKDFADYKLLKGIDGMSVALGTLIVMPVLIEAIYVLRQGEDEDLRWVRVLRKKLDALELKIDEPLESAQRLLELPLKRTLASVRMLAEGDS